ncbi:hypothetical protein D3C75_1177850 [compost metagenome]
MFADHPIAWQIPGPGLALAPGTQLAQYCQLCPGQLPGQLGFAVKLVGVDLATQLRHQFGAIFEHPGVFLVRQLRAQPFIDFGQVNRVFSGVADLGLRQRAL